MVRTKGRERMSRGIWLFLGIVVSCGLCWPAAAQTEKKLLEYGWDVPYPTYVRQNIAEMEKRPFDGLVFRLETYNAAFDPRAWAQADLQPQLDDLAATNWQRFTDNFLTLYAANDAGMDWSDDAQWQTIEANLRLVSLAVKTGRCVGVCFDAEPYGANPWLYDAGGGVPFADTAAIVRKRGAQFVSALRDQMPDLKVLLLFHATFLAGVLQSASPEAAEEALKGHPYALYPAFVNGMIDAVDGGAGIVDGNEMAYYYTNAKAFTDARDFIRGPARALIAPENHEKYAQHMKVGMSVYMDQVMATRTPEAGFVSYYMPPEARLRRMEHNVYWAMAASDEYTWFYSERMNWWKGEIPDGMEEAIRSAEAKVRNGEPLGFDIQQDLDAADTAMQEAIGPRVQPRTAQIPRLADGQTAPVIDGDLSDPAWAAVDPLAAFVPNALDVTKQQPDAATTAWVTRDAMQLYIAIRCAEPNMAGLSVQGGSRDDPVWMGDSVDVFLSTGADPEPYVHLIINPANVQWDAFTGEFQNDTTWDAEWRSATARGDDSWTIELAIPWAALGGPPAPGTTRRANLCRNRAGGHELSSWSPVAEGFVEPRHFGTWEFAD